MYYPMRVVRTPMYKLIHNLNSKMPFSIDQDFYISPTFQDLLNRTRKGEATHWFKTLGQYYYRDQWELYDLMSDPMERYNLAEKPMYEGVLKKMKLDLLNWQNVTSDPWICAPWGVLENVGAYKTNPQCMSMDNNVL